MRVLDPLIGLTLVVLPVVEICRIWSMGEVGFLKLLFSVWLIFCFFLSVLRIFENRDR